MVLDEVIKKTILTTLAAIGALLLFTIAGLCAFFPSTSMELAYDLGMESSCIHFAERSYKSSKDVYFIAYATEVAIEENNTDKIVSCGEKFIADDDFDKYCAAKGDRYALIVYRQVCVSKYEKGEKDGAVALAYNSLNGAFPSGNALVAVAFSALKAQDTQVLADIIEKMNEIEVDGADGVYLEEIKGALIASGNL